MLEQEGTEPHFISYDRNLCKLYILNTVTIDNEVTLCIENPIFCLIALEVKGWSGSGLRQVF